MFILFFNGIVLGQSSYFENFDDPEFWSGGPAGSYTSKMYTNPDAPLNDQFMSNDAVRESSHVQTGYAWRLRNSETPYFIYEYDGDVISFSVFLAHWNVNVAMNITIEYSINSGVNYTLIESLNETWWTGQSYGDKEYRQFFSGDLNISPAGEEKIFLRIITNGNERLLIDDFQLFYNSGSTGVQDPLSFNATTASESQIDLIFVPNNSNDDVVIVYDENGSFEDPSDPLPSIGQPFAGGTLFYTGTSSPQNHTGLMPNQTVYYKAWSFDGYNYSNGLTDQATTSGSISFPNAWINEIHYDNEGGDIGEFIEIAIENVEIYDLANLSVSLYNGSNGEIYASETVDNCEMGNTINNYTFYNWYHSGIQNGAPEGMALAMNGTLIPGQFLSYEGVFIATEGPATGQTSSDIGVQEPTSNPVGFSLQLAGSGIYYNHFNWENPFDDTPGSLNNMQEIGNFTVWTGTIDNDWNDDGNWDNGIPASFTNAFIPDVSILSAPFPVIMSFAEVADLVIDQSSTLEIEVNGALTVNGSFTNYGILNIRSDDSGTGSLIESNGVSAVVERHFTPDQWHYVSSPITTLFSDVFEGLFLMEWDEPGETWTFIEELGIPLISGINAYSVWSNTSSTVEFSGMLNTGIQSINVTNTEGTLTPENDPSGYNLVGNPYPSSLNWDVEDGSGWTRTSTNVAMSIYYWNGSQYASYVKGGPNPGPNGGSNIIPPHQGFFVKCIANSGGSLMVNNNARIHSDQAFYKKGKVNNEFLRMEVNGNQFSDELILNINEDATFEFDEYFDASKLLGCADAPQLYSFGTDGSKLSVNTIPYVQPNITIQIGFETESAGLYDLMLTEINGFDNIPVYLEDKHEQRIIDLKLTGAYKFFTEPDSFEDRFVVHLFSEEIPVQQESNPFETPIIFVNGNKVVVSVTQPLNGRVSIIDLWGREIASTDLSGSEFCEIDITGKHGFYIVRVITSTGMYAQKVYITK